MNTEKQQKSEEYDKMLEAGKRLSKKIEYESKEIIRKSLEDAIDKFVWKVIDKISKMPWEREEIYEMIEEYHQRVDGLRSRGSTLVTYYDNLIEKNMRLLLN